MSDVQPNAAGYYWALRRGAKDWEIVEVERTEDGIWVVSVMAHWDQRPVGEFAWGPRVERPTGLKPSR